MSYSNELSTYPTNMLLTMTNVTNWEHQIKNKLTAFPDTGKLIIGKLSEFIGILTANCCTVILRPFQRCFWSY